MLLPPQSIDTNIKWRISQYKRFNLFMNNSYWWCLVITRVDRPSCTTEFGRGRVSSHIHDLATATTPHSRGPRLATCVSLWRWVFKVYKNSFKNLKLKARFKAYLKIGVLVDLLHQKPTDRISWMCGIFSVLLFAI